MATFLALYRGDSISSAKLLDVSADPAVVRDFAARILEGPAREQGPDPVLEELARGRRRALQLVRNGAQ